MPEAPHTAEEAMEQGQEKGEAEGEGDGEAAGCVCCGQSDFQQDYGPRHGGQGAVNGRKRLIFLPLR